MSRLAFSTVVLGAALACGAVTASSAEAQSTAPAVPPAAVKAPPPKALTQDEMAAINGGSAVSVAVLNREELTGASTGNTITAGTLISGPVNFAPNALNGFNGIGNFVVNTGANNTLQGAINVSVVTTPPAP